MPRKNRPTRIKQTPKDGRVRRSTFWHAIAAGIRPLDEVVTGHEPVVRVTVVNGKTTTPADPYYR